MLGQDDRRLRQRPPPAGRPRPPVDALHPALGLRRRPTCRSSCAVRAPTSTTPTASATSTAWPACSSASWATGAPSSPRPRRSRPQQLAFMPLWSYAHPNAIELAERVADYAPGDLNRVFFTTGGGEAVETAWKLAKNYFKLTGKPDKHKVISRAIAYHGTTAGRAVDHRAAGHEGSRSSRWCPRRSGSRTPTSTARRYIEDDREAVRPLGRRPDRGRDRERGPRHRRRGLPRAGPELRRLLPAAARLLRAGPRDLRRVRRAAGQRRGHLRLRPAGPHVRRRALRLPARHDHLRQGHHLRLRTARRDDRDRPADGAVPARAPRPSSTATPSAATRSRPRSRWPTSTSSRSEKHQRARPRATRRAFRATLEKLKDLPIVGDVRGDGYFYGIELVKDKATKETFNDEESERLLRGFLSKALYDAGPLLPRRRPRRPRRPARSPADLRPGALRRDGADPARRADQGRHPALRAQLDRSSVDAAADHWRGPRRRRVCTRRQSGRCWRSPGVATADEASDRR